MEVTQAFVKAALVRWGEWCHQGGAGAAGFPCETAIGRLRRDGTLISGTGGPRVLTDDPLSEQVDRLVARLRDDDERWPFMLRHYYGSRDATQDTVADALHRRFGVRPCERAVRDSMRLAEATLRGMLRIALDTGTGAG